MNKTLKIVAMVAAGFIVIGIGIGILGSQLGGGILYKDNFFGFGFDNYPNKSFASTETTLEPFTSILVDSDYMELVLKPSPTEEWSVSTYHSQNSSPAKIALVDDILHVTSEKGDALPVSNLSRHVTVYYPTHATFDLIDVNIPAAELYFEMLSTEKMVLHLNAGDVSMSHVTSQNTDIDIQAGALELEGCTLNNVNALLTVGDLNAEDLISENFQGDFKLGNVSIEGDLTGTVDLAVDTGNVELSLTQEESIYDLNLQVDVGTIEVNNRDYLRDYTSQTSGENPMDVNVHMGIIDVEFMDR